jgi:hypothetical protein
VSVVFEYIQSGLERGGSDVISVPYTLCCILLVFKEHDAAFYKGICTALVEFLLC